VSHWISYQNPIIQPLEIPALAGSKVRVLVRREDQNHPLVSGNKWWKLKYNLQHALEQKHNTALTFGGAYSNHIYATAAACRELGLKSIGVIRGEEVRPLNDTLAFAEACGMQFYFVSRTDYREKQSPTFIKSLEEKFGRCYIIPEGGTNALAVKGCEEFGQLVLADECDYVCLPVGTGGTIAGIINAFEGKRKIIGIPVLKDGGFLIDEIQNLITPRFNNWQLLLDYHHGGYAKTSPELNQFIQNLSSLNIPTEQVYSGKLFWAVFDLIKKGFFEEGSTVMILHTGGLRLPHA
jgi:1-aminocyclopropane-1-carboxylate deaminase